MDEQEINQLRKAYLYTFQTEAGKQVLADLKRGFHLNEPMYLPGRTTDLDLAFREGQRSVVVWITNTIESAMESEEVQTHSEGTGQPQEEPE